MYSTNNTKLRIFVLLLIKRKLLFDYLWGGVEDFVDKILFSVFLFCLLSNKNTDQNMSTRHENTESGAQNKLDIEAFRHHLLNYRYFILYCFAWCEQFFFQRFQFYLDRKPMNQMLIFRINLIWIQVSSEFSMKNDN